MKGVTTSPQRGKPASAKRRARQTLVSSLLLVLGVCYVASYRWKAKKIDAGWQPCSMWEAHLGSSILCSVAV